MKSYHTPALKGGSHADAIRGIGAVVLFVALLNWAATPSEPEPLPDCPLSLEVSNLCE